MFPSLAETAQRLAEPRSPLTLQPEAACEIERRRIPASVSGALTPQRAGSCCHDPYIGFGRMKKRLPNAS